MARQRRSEWNEEASALPRPNRPVQAVSSSTVGRRPHRSEEVQRVGEGELLLRPEPADQPRPPGKRPFPLQRAELARLPAAYWRTLAVVAVSTLARFSEAFLILRAQDAGLPAVWVPLVIVVMNLVYAGGAYPLGALADRMDRGRLLGFGVALLVAADVVLAFAPSWPVVLAGAGLWGLHMAATQGLLSAIVADAAPADLRGSAFGVFNLAQGLALLVASVLAGLLWTAAGPSATFMAGAAFALLSLLLLRIAKT